LRYLLIATAFVALTLSVVACGSGRGASKAGLTQATNAACATALPLSKAHTANYEKDVRALFFVAALDGRAAGERAMQAFRANLTAWSEQLTALTRQPIESDVQAALTQVASAVMKLADPNDSTPIDTAAKNLSDATAKLEAACTRVSRRPPRG
jgi:hypothetical protein